MTDDVLDRLRASDPLPDGSRAPAFEAVMAQIEAEARPSRPRSLIRYVMPAFSAAIAIAVLVFALGDLRAHSRHPTHSKRASARPGPAPAAPSGGMPGDVTVWGVGFPSAADGVISLQQCLGCRGDANQTAHSRDRYWLLTTSDGGRSWTLSARGYYVQQPVFAGANGWAGGLQATGPQSGGIARYYVTHDRGRSWTIAPTAAPNEGGALVSLRGGEVWAVGLSERVAILHAPVTGNRLQATATQPIQGGQTNVIAVAAGADTAYVANGTARRAVFATHDDGRSWQRVAPPCPPDDQGWLIAAFGESVWASCASLHSQGIELARSDDGGRSWRRLPMPMPSALDRIEPVSAQVAWALAGPNEVLETTDGGTTWRTVWSANDPRDAPLSGGLSPAAAATNSVPVLVAQSPTSATVVTLITRSRHGHTSKLTNLVAYRTTDGGQSWHTAVIPLARR